MAKEIIQIGNNISLPFYRGNHKTSCINFNKKSKKNFHNRTICNGEGFHSSAQITSLGGG